MSDATNAGAGVVSKGDFARMIGVTPGRVSQYIKEGRIGRDALAGDGVRSKIKVDLARAQLRNNLDVGQRFGNGLATKLDGPPAASMVPSLVMQDPSSSSFDARIKAAKLQDLEIRNRKAQEEELERRGIYTATADVEVGYGLVASGMVNVFEGALSELASAVAAQFEVPARDVLHLLRNEFRTIRLKASDAAKRAAKALPAIKLDDSSSPEDTP